MDLKEVRTVIILEPFWHPGRIAQVKGRAVRYDSHKNLDIKDRTVDIYNLYIKKPSSVITENTIPTGDELLIKINERKMEYINILESVSAQNSIENDANTRSTDAKVLTPKKNVLSHNAKLLIPKITVGSNHFKGLKTKKKIRLANKK